MGFSLQLQEITFCGLLLLVLSLLVALYKTKDHNKNKCRRSPPEPAGAWPLIGHLHLLGGANKLLHRTLAAMADEYGPAFWLRIGIHRTLVVSNWQVAQECFTANDKVFSTRPKFFAVKLMGYDHAMFGLAPYGQYWRDIRKLAVVELLSNHRLELLLHIRDSEINCLIKELYEKCIENGGQALVEMKEGLGDMAMNIIVRMVAGKRYFGSGSSGAEESRQCQKALASFLYFVGVFMATDAVPFLGWLDFVRGYVREMKKTARDLDCVVGRWVDEHRHRRLRGSIEQEEQDFIHVMLSVMDEGELSADEVDTVIKATCLTLILAGSDTTLVTLTWAISLLLNNPHKLKKAQEELDVQVGKHREVKESDIKHLLYLQAIVKETLRLYPPGPLSVPHEAMEDCTVAGFHVPARTHLFVNLWKLQRDPCIWSNPLEFQPERFLTEHAHMDVRGQNFEFIPFGSGRRSCPGISFALQVLHLSLARLLHGFNLERVSEELVDMSEGPGMTMPKATPLEVLLVPRLPSMLYG
ncbi:hypothetical protein FNV43_RR22745 [Rhamnella rubrinervis]|uniref:Cytochrome P450 n=1 Tax=Rhamnella rubrinervis TaxID=2594499 RepID=A0A8K0GRE3_9ROSA|nr:hypothetical protein FNV43_RR22745 [Rhamnella rubrinervis]